MTGLTLHRLSAGAAERELSGVGDISWFARGPSEEDLVVLGIAANGIPTWLILDEGRCVGMIGTHDVIETGSTPEIGYHVVAPARGRGVATRALGLLVLELGIADVVGMVAEVDPMSPHRGASLAVLRANGFVRLDAATVSKLFVEPVDGADLLHRSLP